MKINSTKWSMIRRTVNTISRELGNIDIYETSDELFTEEKKPVTWGINWPAMGTKSVSETKEFMVRMQKAIDIAEFLNNCGFEIKWSEEFEITEGTKDYWLREMQTLKTAIENQKLDLVWDFVEIETN